MKRTRPPLLEIIRRRGTGLELQRCLFHVFPQLEVQFLRMINKRRSWKLRGRGSCGAVGQLMLRWLYQVPANASLPQPLLQPLPTPTTLEPCLHPTPMPLWTWRPMLGKSTSQSHPSDVFVFCLTARYNSGFICIHSQGSSLY